MLIILSMETGVAISLDCGPGTFVSTMTCLEALTRHSLNARPDREGRVEFSPSSADLWPCVPPHPARGSDTHRILVCVLRHPAPLDAAAVQLAKDVTQEPESRVAGRLLDVRLVLGDRSIELVGIQFYRTCWTRQVSAFYSQMGIARVSLALFIL